MVVMKHSNAVVALCLSSANEWTSWKTVYGISVQTHYVRTLELL